MNKIQNSIKKFDSWQQNSNRLAFIVATIHRFGQQKTGYQAALITYYGFLSLFPLLLVFTSIVNIVASGNQQFKKQILEYASSYIPILSDQLQSNIQASSKSGLILVVSLLLLFYGARAGADAFRYAVNNVWQTPKKQRLSFPANYFSSVYIIILGGIGFLASAALSAYAGGLGSLFVFKLLSLALNGLLLTATFFVLFKIALTKSAVTNRDLIIGSVLSGIGILILHLLGGYILTSQLRNLRDLYGTFALILGVLFWIYLQVRVVMFSLMANYIHKEKLWPISLLDEENTTK